MDRIARALAHPLIVALALAPFVLWLWALWLTGAPMAAFEVFQLAFLAVGGGLYLIARQSDAPPDRSTVGPALLAAIAVLVAQAVATVAKWPPTIPPDALAAMLGRMVVFIALAEEIWFRGLWMRACKRNAVLAIVLGSALFGLMHWPLGADRVIATGAIGALYATARWKGAPIWALALVHGVVNWVGSGLAPGMAWRFGPVLSQAVFAGIVLAAAALIWVKLTNREEEQ